MPHRSISISLRHEHVVAVLATVGDHQGELGVQLSDPDDAVEALVTVLHDHLSIGCVLAVSGLERCVIVGKLYTNIIFSRKQSIMYVIDLNI